MTCSMTLESSRPTETRHHFLTGPRDRWVNGVRGYHEVTVRRLFDGGRPASW